MICIMCLEYLDNHINSLWWSVLIALWLVVGIVIPSSHYAYEHVYLHWLCDTVVIDIYIYTKDVSHAMIDTIYKELPHVVVDTIYTRDLSHTVVRRYCIWGIATRSDSYIGW